MTSPFSCHSAIAAGTLGDYALEEAASRAKTRVNSGQESRGKAAPPAAAGSAPLVLPQSKIAFVFSFVLLLATSSLGRWELRFSLACSST